MINKFAKLINKKNVHQLCEYNTAEKLCGCLQPYISCRYTPLQLQRIQNMHICIIKNQNADIIFKPQTLNFKCWLYLKVYYYPFDMLVTLQRLV